jgi:hypothetical protein
MVHAHAIALLCMKEGKGQSMQGEQKSYQLNIFQRKPASISVDIVSLPEKGQTAIQKPKHYGAIVVRAAAALETIFGGSGI